jgi:hypothetical protein
MTYHGAAIRMPNQDDVPQVLPEQKIDDVRDVGVETDVSAQHMYTFSETCQCRREDLVSFGR